MLADCAVSVKVTYARVGPIFFSRCAPIRCDAFRQTVAGTEPVSRPQRPTLRSSRSAIPGPKKHTSTRRHRQAAQHSADGRYKRSKGARGYRCGRFQSGLKRGQHGSLAELRLDSVMTEQPNDRGREQEASHHADGLHPGLDHHSALLMHLFSSVL